MKKVGLFFYVLLFTVAANAGDWYGYCHFKKEGQTYCNGIKEKDSNFDDYCKNFALSHNAYSWKMQYSTSVEWLQNKQGGHCDQVLAGPGTNKFSCYVVTYCQGAGGPTSSIAPLNINVFAGNKNMAIEKCLAQGENAYLNYLQENSKDGCFTKVDGI